MTAAIPAFLPWQVDIATPWIKRGDKLAHAWLIHGQTGIGKRQFGLALATSLLCEQPVDHLACGQCQACLWVRLGNHPDLMRVRPEAQELEEGIYQRTEADSAAASRSNSARPSEIIKVEQIRLLEPWYHRTTHRAGWRIVLLYPAESMMAESANALLKALEEPPESTLFLLISDSPDRLLPTILSRCQKMKLPLPDAAASTAWLTQQGLKDSEQWLAVAGGAPLRALELSQNQPEPYAGWLGQMVRDMAQQNAVPVTEIAENLSKEPAYRWLADLQRLCIDVSLTCAGLKPRYFVGLETELGRLGRQRTLTQWTAIEHWITSQIPLGHHPLNAKLFAQACLQKVVTV
ncbi:DNA polymerase III subunit delta' [Orrella marina]|uniref:DNA polymerase III subunit delta' n=1 Tax=Orrella marina TaxID=2163011 RepID=UPI00131F2927|nr:DNA polymerase III subunit delta' [Orrella marina]